MKFTSEMLLDQNWNKYLLTLDREETSDLARDYVVDNYCFKNSTLTVDEKVEELLDEVDNECIVWSLNKLDGCEGGWIYHDLLDLHTSQGMKKCCIHTFMEIPEDMEYRPHYIVEMNGNEVEDVCDDSDDIYETLLNFKIIK